MEEEGDHEDEDEDVTIEEDNRDEQVGLETTYVYWGLTITMNVAQIYFYNIDCYWFSSTFYFYNFNFLGSSFSKF